MDTADYEIRLLTEHNEQAWNRLFTFTFTTGLPDNLFKWKYFSNPFGNAIVAGAFANNELVAAGALIPELNYFDGNKELLYKFTDLMVNPAHQKRGLANKIIARLNKEAVTNNAGLLYTLCSKIATKGFLKNNWCYKGQMINYFKPRQLLRLQFAFNNPQKLIDNKTISIASDTSLLQSYFTEPKPSHQFLISMNNEWLNWRLKHPRFHYNVLLYNSGNAVVGYLLLSNNTQTNMLSIVDVGAVANDPKIKDELLVAAEFEAFKSSSRALVVPCMHQSHLRQLIKGKNYLSNPFKRGPLKSELDFNICFLKDASYYGDQTQMFDISALNYDDI